MNGRGYASAASYEIRAVESVDGHDGRAPQEAAELDHLADIFARHGDDAHRRRLVIHDADGHLVGDDRTDGLGSSLAGHGDHVYPDRADARPGFQFFERES